MTNDKQLRRALDLLQLKLEKLEVNDAVSLINKENTETENQDWVPHYEVHKASLLRNADRVSEAAQLLQEVVLRYPDVDSVSYFAGEYFLELGKYAEAITFFSDCMAIGVKSGEHWYLDSARLLRAFCAAKIGDRRLATQDLASIPDDEEISWLSVDSAISKSSVLSMITSK